MRFSPKLQFAVQKHIASIHLQELRDYADELELLLAREAKRVGERLDAQAASLPEDVREEFYSDHSDRYQNLVNEFPERLRLNLVTLFYSALEESVVAAAETVLKVRDFGLRLSDLKGDQFTRAKTVLVRVAKIGVPEAKWNALVPYELLRNAIVHSGGHIVKEHNKSKALREFIVTGPDSTVGASGNVAVGSEFLKRYLNEIAQFQVALFAALDAWVAIRVAPSS